MSLNIIEKHLGIFCYEYHQIFQTDDTKSMVEKYMRKKGYKFIKQKVFDNIESKIMDMKKILQNIDPISVYSYIKYITTGNEQYESKTNSALTMTWRHLVKEKIDKLIRVEGISRSDLIFQILYEQYETDFITINDVIYTTTQFITKNGLEKLIQEYSKRTGDSYIKAKMILSGSLEKLIVV